MSFLYCNPSVFVIGDEYEILAVTNENGIIGVRVGEELYYEENSGALSSEKNYARVRVPQCALNEAKEYTVVYRKTVNRRAYYSIMGDEECETFSFKPLEKTENINIYHIADVHYKFSLAKGCAKYFGDETDLFILNGDIGEVETVENYLEVCKFSGDVSEGRIPVIFARGNHDTRGRLAERYTDFFPSNGKDTYFTFSIGCLNGIALDCGEDKMDDHESAEGMKHVPGAVSPSVYGGVNSFSAFRKRELGFLERLKLDSDGRITFAVSHICPVRTHGRRLGDTHDIERECYTAWNENLERLGVRFMINGHLHKAFILSPDSDECTVKHSYPVIFGSSIGGGILAGAAITVNKGELTVRFTDQNCNVLESHTVSI